MIGKLASGRAILDDAQWRMHKIGAQSPSQKSQRVCFGAARSSNATASAPRRVTCSLPSWIRMLSLQSCGIAEVQVNAAQCCKIPSCRGAAAEIRRARFARGQNQLGSREFQAICPYSSNDRDIEAHTYTSYSAETSTTIVCLMKDNNGTCAWLHMPCVCPRPTTVALSSCLFPTTFLAAIS